MQGGTTPTRLLCHTPTPTPTPRATKNKSPWVLLGLGAGRAASDQTGLDSFGGGSFLHCILLYPAAAADAAADAADSTVQYSTVQYNTQRLGRLLLSRAPRCCPQSSLLLLLLLLLLLQIGFWILSVLQNVRCGFWIHPPNFNCGGFVHTVCILSTALRPQYMDSVLAEVRVVGGDPLASRRTYRSLFTM